jgi:hypothetical protein
VRDEDMTGVSGTGVVAEGVEFTDEVVVLRWVGKYPTSVVWHDGGLESVRKIHGHDGKTRIVFDEPELEHEEMIPVVPVVQKMIAEVDSALHGFTHARDKTPAEVWESLLSEIRSVNR